MRSSIVLLVVLMLLCSLSGLAQSQDLAATQVLRAGSPAADVGTLDPHFATAIGETPVIWIRLYEGLVFFQHKGIVSLENLQPGLATSWNVSEDGKVWTFHLREGVQWHHGYGEFTADDVKFSIERVLSPDVGSPWRSDFRNIEKVEVIDTYTVAITTKEEDPILPALLTPIRGGCMMSRRAVEDLGDEISHFPVGTGPFQFNSYRPMENVTLIRNENYWGERAILDAIEFIFMPDDSTREMALRGGEIHTASIPATKEWIDRVRNAGFEVDLTTPGNMFFIQYNLKREPLDDIRVRQALNYAINRQDFLSFYGEDVIFLEYAPVASYYEGATTDVERYDFDLEKAKALLEEAGYPDGFVLQVYMSESEIYLPPMQIIQAQWKRIGVELDMTVVDHPTYHSRIREDANDVIMYGAWRWPLTAGIYLNQFWHSASNVLKPTTITNFSHYGDVDATGDGVIDSVDTYIEEGLVEMDPQRRRELYFKAQEQIMAHAAGYPLYTRPYGMARVPTLELGHEQISHSYYVFTEKTKILQ